MENKERVNRLRKVVELIEQAKSEVEAIGDSYTFPSDNANDLYDSMADMTFAITSVKSVINRSI